MKLKNIAKKMTAILIAISLCFNLVACGNDSKNKNDDSKNNYNGNLGSLFDSYFDDDEDSTYKDDDSLFEDDDSLFEDDDPFFDSSSSSIDGNSDGVVEYKELSMNKLTAQCAKCENAVNKYSELIETAYEKLCNEDSHYTDCVTIINIGKQLYEALDHSCSAEVIYVVDAPFSIYGSYGFYTGNWQGSGPVGQGSYTGTDVWKGEIVTYDGEWAHGLPEGYGKLYIGNFLGHYWDMDYCGYMYKGMRHGSGVWMESGYGKMIETGPCRYRIYESTIFQNDVMVYETAYEEYFEDGTLSSYGKMKGSEDGWVYMTEVHDANEMSDREVLAYALGITAISIGIVCMLDFGESEYTTPYECTPEGIEEWRANKEAERLAEEERQAAEKEKNRLWHEDKYYECIDNGDTYSLDYQRHKYMSGN